jgi:hypothetical protein
MRVACSEEALREFELVDFQPLQFRFEKGLSHAGQTVSRQSFAWLKCFTPEASADKITAGT